MPHRPYFWGVWSFAQNKTAGMEFIEYMSQREQVEALSTAVVGYDIPPFESMSDLPKRLRAFPLVLIPLLIALPWLIAIQMKSR